MMQSMNNPSALPDTMMRPNSIQQMTLPMQKSSSEMTLGGIHQLAESPFEQNEVAPS